MLHAHLIFITKYRGKILDQPILERMEAIMKGICLNFEVELTEFNGEHDHVHLLINYPPKVQLSKLINSLKGVSSRLIRKEFTLVKYHWIGRESGALWSPSYFAGSVGGASIDVLRQYIEQQNRPH
jgi:putative transposase